MGEDLTPEEAYTAGADNNQNSFSNGNALRSSRASDIQTPKFNSKISSKSGILDRMMNSNDVTASGPLLQSIHDIDNADKNQYFTAQQNSKIDKDNGIKPMWAKMF